MTPALERWLRVVSALEALQPPDPDDAAWFVKCHRQAVERGQAVEVAFGLTQRGGTGGLARADALVRRDTHLRELHARFYFDLEPRAAARAIIALADRRKRSAGAAGGPRESLMDAAILTGERIPKQNQLATILQFNR